MVHKLIVLYTEPTDRAAFEEYYVSTHLPLCAQLPGVEQINYALNLSGPFYAMFEASFASEDALQMALASDEGQAVQADVPNYATGEVVVFTAPQSSYSV